MHIAEFIKANKISVKKAARAIRVSDKTVYRYINGDITPGREVMRNIVRWSKGAVTPNDFYGERGE